MVQRIHELARNLKAGQSGAGWALAQHLITLASASPAPAGWALDSIGPDGWSRLDTELRNGTYMPGSAGPPHGSAILGGVERGETLAVLVAACSGDGRVRERAVTSPAMGADPRLLPILVIRTADWAGPVRDRARLVLAGALAGADAAALITALEMASRMRDRSRGRYALDVVTEALRTGRPETFEAARAATDLRVRRMAYELWTEPGRTDVDALVNAALTETDLVCRTLSAEAAARHAVGTGSTEILQRLLAVRSSRVRLAALTGLVKIGRPEFGEPYLADRTAMMRATAQWAMRRTGVDPAGSYRLMLGSGATVTPGMVAGLGDCGTAEDLDLLTGFLDHPRARVRADAVRAVRRLGGTLPQIATLLTDPSPAVVRAATAALRTQSDPAPVEELFRLLGEDQPRHIRIGAHHRLADRDVWARMRADLLLLDSADPVLRESAHADLRNWLRRTPTSYAEPTQGTRDLLAPLIAAAAPALGEKTTRELRWHLGIRPPRTRSCPAHIARWRPME